MSKKDNKDMVYQSNHLIESSYDTDLTGLEHKIIRYAALRMKRSPSSFPRVTFSIDEFLEAGEISGQGYYSRVNKVVDELSRKRIKIKKDDRTGWFPWFSSIVYQQGEGQIDMEFNHNLEPLILHLQSGYYTKYEYRIISLLQSSYSIRLFELLQQYKKIGQRTIDLQTLKSMLGVTDKYKKYSHFKQRVLEQAKKEINQHNQTFSFDYQENKKGKKVHSLTFHMDESNYVSSDMPEDDQIFITEAQLLLDSYNILIPTSVLQKWASHYTTSLLSKALQSVSDWSSITDKAKYIEGILRNKKEERPEEQLPEQVQQLIAELKQLNEPVPGWLGYRKLANAFDFTEGSASADKMWQTYHMYIEPYLSSPYRR